MSPSPGSFSPVHVHCRSRGFMRRMCPERAAIAVRVHLRVVKIVAAQRISTEGRIVLIRRQDKRSSAPPSSHKLGSNQLLLFRCFAMGSEEIAKRAYVFFHLKKSNIAAIARKNFRLWHSGSRAFFVRIAKKKFAWLDRWARAGRRLYSRSLNDRL